MEDQVTYDIRRLEKKIDSLVETVGHISVGMGAIGVSVENIHDHEVRIRGLERFRYAFPSVAVLSLLASGIGIAITIYTG